METSDKELQEKLAEAGNALLAPPSLVIELLPLIKRLESSLLSVTQSPCASMQRALEIPKKALLNTELFDSKNTSVRVYVASCLIEMARITAPDPPYDDITMEGILKLIVAAFDNLSDISHCLYQKRVSILQSFSKIRLFHMISDLKCHDLSSDMFKHFLNNIREHHPNEVYFSMGFIMILLVDESDEIPLEIISILLEFVRKENKEVSPKAWKLAKNVIDNCSSKLAPYMIQAVKQKGSRFEDYSKLVAFVCKLPDATHRGFESSEEDDLAELQEDIFSLDNCSSEAATPGKHDTLRNAKHLSAENHSVKSGASNMKSQESRRKRTKNQKEVSSSKANVGESSTAESRHEKRVNTKHESLSDLLLLDHDSTSSSI